MGRDTGHDRYVHLELTWANTEHLLGRPLARDPGREQDPKQGVWSGVWDLNPRPKDYESSALTN